MNIDYSTYLLNKYLSLFYFVKEVHKLVNTIFKSVIKSAELITFFRRGNSIHTSTLMYINQSRLR